jgi:biopolymer transport protein TolR
MRRRRQSQAKAATGTGLAARADINVTPLIDVLLVLLILFLLVSRAARAELRAGLARQGPVGPVTPAVTVSVRETDLRLDDRPVLDVIALQAALGAALHDRSDRPVWVRSSPGVSYERLVAVLDAARGAGAVRIGIVGASVSPDPP